MAQRAKLLRIGESQAVLLPKLWFEGEEVLVSREGNRVILEPVHGRRTWSQAFLDLAGSCSDFPDPDSTLARELEDGYRAEAEDPSLDEEWPR